MKLTETESEFTAFIYSFRFIVPICIFLLVLTQLDIKISQFIFYLIIFLSLFSVNTELSSTYKRNLNLIIIISTLTGCLLIHIFFLPIIDSSFLYASIKIQLYNNHLVDIFSVSSFLETFIKSIKSFSIKSFFFFFADVSIILSAFIMALLLFFTKRWYKKRLLGLIPNSHFEFTAYLFAKMTVILRYIRFQFFQALFIAAMWALSFFLLGLPDKPELVMITFLCALTPQLGLWCGALLIFINFLLSPLSYFQLIGLFISLAVIWFVRYVLSGEQIKKHSIFASTHILLLILIGYVSFGIIGLFILPPIGCMSIKLNTIYNERNRVISTTLA